MKVWSAWLISRGEIRRGANSERRSSRPGEVTLATQLNPVRFIQDDQSPNRSDTAAAWLASSVSPDDPQAARSSE